jgi:hypothetical protein
MKYASLPIFRIATDADLTDILFIEQGEQSSWNESTLRNALHSQYTVILALYENKIIGFAIVSTVVEEAELLHIAHSSFMAASRAGYTVTRTQQLLLPIKTL